MKEAGNTTHLHCESHKIPLIIEDLKIMHND